MLSRNTSYKGLERRCSMERRVCQDRYDPEALGSDRRMGATRRSEDAINSLHKS